MILLLIPLSMMLSCSSGFESAPLFHGDPGIKELPAGLETQQVIGDAPPVKFSTLKYENHIIDKLSGKTSLTNTSIVNLEEKGERLAVIKTDYYVVYPNGNTAKLVTDVDVGVPGIISFAHLTTKHQSPRQIQFRKLVRRFENVTDALFPLDKGSQISFKVAFAYQVTQGGANNPTRELRWSYRFRALDIYEGYTFANGSIPGKIYVIDRYEVDPEGSVDNTLVHYSESLGAAIKTLRENEDIIEETRLVSVDE